MKTSWNATMKFAAVVVATLTGIISIGAGVASVASAKAAIMVAPVELKLAEHKAGEDVWKAGVDDSLKRVERKLDKLIDRELNR